MYKQKTKTRLEKSKRPFQWIKRKLLLFITAFMIGMGNVINEEENLVMGNQHQIEQEDKKD